MTIFIPAHLFHDRHFKFKLYLKLYKISEDVPVPVEQWPQSVLVFSLVGTEVLVAHHLLIVLLVVLRNHVREVEFQGQNHECSCVLNVGQQVIQVLVEGVKQEPFEKLIEMGVFLQVLWGVREETDHLLLRVEIKPHDEYEVDERQGEHSGLVAKRLDIHDRKVDVLAQPSEVIVRLKYHKKLLSRRCSWTWSTRGCSQSHHTPADRHCPGRDPTARPACSPSCSGSGCSPGSSATWISWTLPTLFTRGSICSGSLRKGKWRSETCPQALRWSAETPLPCIACGPAECSVSGWGIGRKCSLNSRRFHACHLSRPTARPSSLSRWLASSSPGVAGWTSSCSGFCSEQTSGPCSWYNQANCARSW